MFSAFQRTPSAPVVPSSSSPPRSTHSHSTVSSAAAASATDPVPPPASSSQVSFDDYVHYAAKAAELAREAILSVPKLQLRLNQLESELQVWKLGHHEANQRARDAQKKLDAGDDMVACFLDGDGCIFDRSLIKKGRDGGREAALALRQSITEYAEEQGVSNPQTVVVTLFLSKNGLGRILQ
ncbi:hypothetical protein JCM10212_003760, partial [Sporobolomyces blumeae]